MWCIIAGFALPLLWEAIVNPIPHTRGLLGLPPPRWSIQRLWRAVEARWRLRRAWPKEVK